MTVSHHPSARGALRFLDATCLVRCPSYHGGVIRGTVADLFTKAGQVRVLVRHEALPRDYLNTERLVPIEREYAAPDVWVQPGPQPSDEWTPLSRALRTVPHNA